MVRLPEGTMSVLLAPLKYYNTASLQENQLQISLKHLQFFFKYK